MSDDHECEVWNAKAKAERKACLKEQGEASTPKPQPGRSVEAAWQAGYAIEGRRATR